MQVVFVELSGSKSLTPVTEQVHAFILLEPIALVESAGQLVQDDAPLALYVFAAQNEQVAAPSALNEPAAQGEHVDAPAALDVPAEQGVHDDAPAALYFPAEQGVHDEPDLKNPELQVKLVVVHVAFAGQVMHDVPLK